MHLQEYLSLPAGSFTFQAQATDLAGNVESSAATTSNSKSWTISLPTTHAIITGGADSHLILDDSAESVELQLLKLFSDQAGVLAAWHPECLLKSRVSPSLNVDDKLEKLLHVLQVAAQAAYTLAMQASRLALTQPAHQPPTSAGWRCTPTPLACGVWKMHSLHAHPLRCCLFFINLVVIGILYTVYFNHCWHKFLLRLRPYLSLG